MDWQKPYFLQNAYVSLTTSHEAKPYSSEDSTDRSKASWAESQESLGLNTQCWRTVDDN